MAVVSPDQRVEPRKTGLTTVASMARDWARRAPHQVAMREKEFGIWHEYTWDRTWNLVLDAAHGLLALGVAVALLGFTPQTPTRNRNLVAGFLGAGVAVVAIVVLILTAA